MPDQPFPSEGAIAGSGAGGAMDLAAGEAATLERPPSALSGGPESTGPAGATPSAASALRNASTASAVVCERSMCAG